MRETENEDMANDNTYQMIMMMPTFSQVYHPQMKREEASIALQRCGEIASLAEVVDFILCCSNGTAVT